MSTVSSTESADDILSRVSKPVPWHGLALCLIATLFFSLSNICVRFLIEAKVDTILIQFLREGIDFAVLMPWIVFRLLQGRYLNISKRCILFLILGSSISQTFGSPLQIWGFAIGGFILTTPPVQAGQILSTAVMGNVLLKERITRTKIYAALVLLLAVFCVAANQEVCHFFWPTVPTKIVSKTEPVAAMEMALKMEPVSVSVSVANTVSVSVSVGVPDTNTNTPETLPQMSTSRPGWLYFLAAIGAFVAGIAFAMSLTATRYASLTHWELRRGLLDSLLIRQWVGHSAPHRTPEGIRIYSPFPLTLLMVIVHSTGFMICGGWTLVNHSWAGFVAVPEHLWLCVFLMAGLNIIGFLALVLGLRQSTATEYSLISATQVVFISLIGVFFFRELSNVMIWTGVVLAVIGVVLSAKQEITKEES